MNLLIVPFCSHAGKPNFPQVLEKYGGDDGTRTRGLCRDSWPFTRWPTQNQAVTCAVVGNRWRYRSPLENSVQRFVQRFDLKCAMHPK